MRLAIVYPSAFLSAVLAVCWVISGRLHVAIYCAGAVASAILGAIAYMTLRIKLSPKTTAKTSLPGLVVAMQQETCERIFQASEHRDRADKSAVVISRSIDQALSDVIDVICREHVMRWLKDMATSPDSIRAGVKRDLEVAAHGLAERLSRVDHVSLLATDVLRKITEHFERVRIALDTPSTPINARQQLPEFRISPHLVSPERELE
jgi:sorting nexin-25